MFAFIHYILLDYKISLLLKYQCVIDIIVGYNTLPTLLITYQIYEIVYVFGDMTFYDLYLFVHYIFNEIYFLYLYGYTHAFIISHNINVVILIIFMIK